MSRGRCMNTLNLSASHSLLYLFGLFPWLSAWITLSGDGTGGWTLARIGTAEARIGIDREIGMLESKLKEVERWERRVKELEVLLGPKGVGVSDVTSYQI